MEKIDGRKSGRESRETLRKMVLRLHKQSGLNGIELARIAGIHVGTAQAWFHKARTQGAGATRHSARSRR